MLEVFNATLYVLVLLVYWGKKRSLDVFIFLWSAFTFTSVMCAITSLYGTPEYPNTTFFPYVYLFICIFLYLSSFRGFSIKGKLSASNNFGIHILEYVFIVTGIMSLYYSLPDAIDLLSSGEWGMLRQLVYEDSDNIELYHSAFERIVKNVNGYLTPLGIVLCFEYLARSNPPKIKLILLWTSWLVPNFLIAILNASRGMVITQFLTAAMCFVLFKDSIPKNVKRVFSFFMAVLAVPVALFTFVVTISRFGEGDAGNSVFEYLGHSMMAFNHGIASMHKFQWGDYAFSFFRELLSLPYSFDEKGAGYAAHAAFYTFVGSIYRDFGPIVTLLIGVVFCNWMKQLTRKNRLNISDLIVLVFVLTKLTSGVFIWGKGYAVEWVMMGIVYFIVRRFEKL